jgi:metal-dependent amidase/aminoacylase/carboxypeptidase family protein
MDLLQEATALPLAEHRQFLHRHAEVGFDLTETVAYVEQQLTSMGLQPKKCGNMEMERKKKV